jgi:biopolymer transport protein ExbD
MKLHRSKSVGSPLFFIAPAFSVALLLVFFVLLSASFMVQPGVTVAMPESPFILMPQRNPQIISITAAPISTIYFENQEVDLPSLKKMLEAEPEQTRESRTIVVKADRFAPYDQVSGVINLAMQLGFPTVLAASAGR